MSPDGGKCIIVGKWIPEGKERLDTSFVIRTSMPYMSGFSHQVVKCTGKGCYPSVRISPEIIHFGVVPIGYITPETFVVTNNGACPVSWSIPYVPKSLWFSKKKSTNNLMPKEISEVDLTVLPTKRGWFNHEIMVCAPDMSSHRMLTITGEAHPLKLGIYPQSIDLSDLTNCGSIDLVNEGGCILKLKIGQGIEGQGGETLGLSSSFGPKPGTWPILSVNHSTIMLKPGVTVTIEFEIDPGPGREDEEEGEDEDEDGDEKGIMSTTIDILSPETSWTVNVTGIIRSSKRNFSPVVREEAEDVIDVFDQSLVFDSKEGETKVD